MLTKDEVVERFNVSPGGVDVLVRQYILLQVMTEEGPRFPSEQFTHNTAINGRFAIIMNRFKRYRLTGNEIWAWLQEPRPELDGATGLEELAGPRNLDRLTLVVTTHFTIESLVDPTLERTDWLKTGDRNIDPEGMGDYTPKRRGGQHGA